MREWAQPIPLAKVYTTYYSLKQKIEQNSKEGRIFKQKHCETYDILSSSYLLFDGPFILMSVDDAHRC